MTKQHRDSQKRIYLQDVSYFMTTKTYNNFPYFKEKIFCELFIENLKLCKELYKFWLFGFVLIYDHFHLLILTEDKRDMSKIMQFLKRNVSRNINFVMDINKYDEKLNNNQLHEGDNDHCRLHVHKLYKFILIKWLLKFRFRFKYPNNPFPKFQWQKSFHDHYIRSDRDFDSHMDYIANNPYKHDLPPEWEYVFMNEKYNYLIDDS